MKIIFTGTTSLTRLWTNDKIDPGSGFPPFPTNDQNTRNYSPNNMSITWDSPSANFSIPGFLNGATVNSLSSIVGTLQSSTVTLQNTLDINILPDTNQWPQPDGAGQSYPALNIRVFTRIPNPTREGPQLSSDISSYKGPIPINGWGYCNSAVSPPCPSTSFDLLNYDPYQIQASPWNVCGTVACFNQTVFNLNLTAQTKIVLTIECKGTTDILNSNLDSGFCLNFCTDTPQNLTFCKLTYQDYCFLTPEGATGPAIIFTESTGCQTFFSDYNSQLGPEAGVDNLITNYCSAKFGNVGFEGLFLATPANSPIDINLCACHMPDSFYIEYANSVKKLEPAFANFISNSGIDQRCLVSYCATSPYPTSKIGKQCQIPDCIQVTEFNNDGSIGGNVNISQNSTCQKIASGQDTGGGGGGGGGTVNETKSWIEKHWVWVVLGVGIFLALIIVILIILFSGGNKNKNIKKK